MTAGILEMDKPAENKPKQERYTTFRIYLSDGQELAKLAALKGITIAETYRELFAKQVSKHLIELTEQALQAMKKKARQG